MAYRISDHRVETHRAPSAEDLRRAFEAAVCELHPADLAARLRLRYHSPIVQRGRIPGMSRADAEKRALSDAARALSLLWKV
jgi:hypothetical protein